MAARATFSVLFPSAPSVTLFNVCPVDAAEVDPLDGGLGGEALAEALGRLADVVRVALQRGEGKRGNN